MKELKTKETNMDEILSEQDKFLEERFQYSSVSDDWGGYHNMKVELISPSSDIAYRDWVVAAFAGTFCTWDEEHEGTSFVKRFTLRKKERLLLKMLKERQISYAMECVNFVFRCTGIPRSLTHQIVRHRKMAFGQQSLRVSNANRDMIMIPERLIKAENENFCNEELYEEFSQKYKRFLQNCKHLYNDMVQADIPREQARMILPMGLTTKICITMQLGTMIDYFRARTSDIAQADHHRLVILMADNLKIIQPKFYNFVCSKVDNLDEMVNNYE